MKDRKKQGENKDRSAYRDAKGRFTPGYPGSGKAGPGRPRTSDIVKKIAAGRSEEAINTLVALMQDAGQDGRVRILAAKEIMDRGIGKVPQAVNAEVSADSALAGLLEIIAGSRRDALSRVREQAEAVDDRE